MPTPLAHSHYEELDLEVGWRLPLTKHIKDSLLGILVLHRRTLRAFEPADHVLHRHPPRLSVEILGTAINGQAVATVQAKNGRYFSRTTSPDTGSVTPTPPPKSSSMSRILSSLAIIFGRAAMMLCMLSHSPMRQ